MEQINLDQIVVFQFRIIDKNKVYAHGRHTGIKLNIFTREKYLVGLYIPPKKLEDGSVYLDESLLRNYLDFINRLRINGIKFYLKVYNERFCVSYGF